MSGGSPPPPRWGAGTSTSARRRRPPVESTAATMRGNEDSVDENLGDKNINDAGIGLGRADNPFESIGRALDKKEEEARRLEEVGRLEQMSLDHDDLDGQDNNDEGAPEDIPAGDRKGPPATVDNGGSFDADEDPEEPTEQATAAEWRLPNDRTTQKKATSTLPRPSVDAGTGGKEIPKKSITPPRFTFQSQSSAKPKRSSFGGSALKTPASRSLPSRSLFPSSAFSQRTANTAMTQRLTQKSIGQSTVKRKQRHTFRPSTGSSNTPAESNTRARERGFAPAFLSQKTTARCPTDAPTEDNGDFETDEGYAAALSRNLVTSHQMRQRARRGSTDSHAAAGALVRRLRALRNDEMRRAMRLRSGQFAASGPGMGGSALMSRKRRRSGGEGLDPKNAASSTLDVTVSSIPISGDDASVWPGEDRSLLVGYIHRHTRTKQPAVQQYDVEKGPGYACILMSNEVLQEQGIVDGGTKQLRLYDAVVIPPRVISTTSSSSLDEADGQREMHLPTVVCTNVCQAAEEPMDEVSFDRFV